MMLLRSGGMAAAILLVGAAGLAMAQSEPPPAMMNQQAQSPAAGQHNSTTGAASTDVPMPPTVTHIMTGNDAAKFNATAAADDARPTLAHALALTDEQRRLIASSVTGNAEGAAPDFKPEVAALMPKSAKVQDLPADVTGKIPWLAPYKVALVGNEILLVDPGNSFVVVNILNR